MKEAGLSAFRCASGHMVFAPQEHCPHCGGALREAHASARATLIACTTVRVGPVEGPFRLGLARNAEGGTTLCRIDDDVDDAEGTPVVLEDRDGILHARRG